MQSCPGTSGPGPGTVTQAQVDAVNELYSKGRSKGRACSGAHRRGLLRKGGPPAHVLLSLAESDAREGRDYSRVFVRMVTNILLHLAAVDDDASLRRPTSSPTAQTGSAPTDSAGRQTLAALNARDFVTSGEPSSIEKHLASGSAQPSGEGRRPPPKGGKPAEKPDFDSLMAELDPPIGLESVKRRSAAL